LETRDGWFSGAGAFLLFTDLTFWVFFAVVGVLYVALPHRSQNRMLLVASYVFYGAWDWRFLSLILASTIVDYLVALKLESETHQLRRKVLLRLSLGTNLGILGIFKYLGFFADSFQALLLGIGYAADPVTLSIVLPVGISFYTFQTLGYSIDVYRRDIRPEPDFLNFALFVAFFPQLVAGPIERAKNLLPNIQQPRSLSWEAFRRGAVLCLLGLIKKVVIADGISPYVDSVFASSSPTQVDVVLAVWFFAIQIYCDFSGYTDIARGVAKALGFNLMRNFAQPYFAANPQEFWQRWHISLSTWLRDYLYFSLGGSHGTKRRTSTNLMATMVLGGLWHGAAWNFLAWGGYQGLILIIHRSFIGRKRGSGEGLKRNIFGWFLRVLRIAVFFQVVCYGWLLFRAESFAQIADMTGRIFGLVETSGGTSIAMPNFASLLGIGLLLIWDLAVERAGNVRFYRSWPLAARVTLYAGMIYFFAFGGATTSSAFIYFAF
jgi:alginate O-acetyltransferase complex protein AlgI